MSWQLVLSLAFLSVLFFAPSSPTRKHLISLAILQWYYPSSSHLSTFGHLPLVMSSPAGWELWRPSPPVAIHFWAIWATINSSLTAYRRRSLSATHAIHTSRVILEGSPPIWFEPMCTKFWYAWWMRHGQGAPWLSTWSIVSCSFIHAICGCIGRVVD